MRSESARRDYVGGSYGTPHTRLLIAVSRSVAEPAWVGAEITKSWFRWGIAGSHSAPIATTGFWVDPAAEAVLVSQVLADLSRVARDDLYRI